MIRLAVCATFLALVCFGCGDSSEGSGGAGGEPSVEWPPDATVYFDDRDVLHADCATDEDCAMVLGYYHASERFVQMDTFRRFSTGRLADILIKPIAQIFIQDFASLRALFSTRDGRPLEERVIEQASPKTVALFEAYSAGVNQWIAELKAGDPNAVFPPEFTHPRLEYSPQDVPEWTPEDCVSSVVALVESLTNEEAAEIAGGVARAQIEDDDKFSDLWAVRPLVESSILPPGWTPPVAEAALGAKAAASGEQSLAATVPFREEVIPAPLLDGAAARPELDALPALRRLSERLRGLEGLRRALGAAILPDRAGSNSWVIAGSRTQNGNALLANDPHITMTQPATFYLAHLDAKTNGRGEFHSAGFTFVGLPWVIIGQNEDIAWGLTSANMDFTDVYEEEVVRDASGNATGVMFRNLEVPFTRIPWTATFTDGSTFRFCDESDCDAPSLLFVSHHGAVRQIFAEPPEDPAADVALTLSWTGADIGTDVNFLTELNAATNVEEARIALENVTTVGQSFVIADTAGSIGWFPYNVLPKRTWATGIDGPAPSWVPLDGRGDFEWEEYFTLEELPQLVDPPEGFIATANNDMTGASFDGDPTSLGPPYQVYPAPGVRHKRIVDLIEAIGDQHSVATMDAIISDVYMLIGETMVPRILELASDPQTGEVSPDGQKVLNALQAWESFECPTGLDGYYTDSLLADDEDVLLQASGCAAFHALLNRLRDRLERNENAQREFGVFSRGVPFASYFSIVDPSKLRAGDVYWDDPATAETTESRDQVLPEALDATGAFLNRELDTDESRWAWGRLHGLVLQSDIGSFLGSDFDNPCSGDLCARPGFAPFANDGGQYTVDVAYPDFNVDEDQEFVQTWGAALRLVCELAPDRPRCTFQLPGGQSGHVDSLFYEDLLFPYLDNEPLPLVFDITEAAANAARTVDFRGTGSP